MLSRGGVLVVVVALAAGFALATVLGEYRERSTPAPIKINTPVPTATLLATATAQPIQVFVNGAVKVPDVYVLPPDSRMKQAVEAAGGFTDEANSAVINLALPLVDGAHIYVPDVVESREVPEQVISKPTDQSRSGTIGVGGMLININTADINELDELPGVGPAIAQKIIDYRTANGSFANIEAILEVSGIGEVKFEGIRDLITTGK